MDHRLPRVLAFVAGFVLAAAAVQVAPTVREPAEHALATEPAPWTQHRAGVMLAQESAEMQQLRASGRIALNVPIAASH